MKFSCDTKTLSEACNNVMKAVSTKGTIPAIEGILFKAKEDCLFLTGYDFEFGINTSIPARVEEPGSVILSAKIFCDIIRRLSDDRVEIDVNERLNANIVCGAAQYSIIGIDAEEYPELPSVSGGVPIVLSQELLQNMVSQTLFAVSDSSENKPVYTGLRFEITKDQLKIIGIDGFRLAIRTEKINYDGEYITFVVPKKTIKELVKIFENGEEEISISVGKRHIVFEVEQYSVISRLLDGEYINYNGIISKNINTEVLINVRTAINCIEKTLPVIDDGNKTPIRCIFDKDMLRVSSVSVLGRVVDTCHANVSGTRVEIGFNSKYILDALRAGDVDEIKICFQDATTPVILVPVEGDSFLFLVSPVRLKKNED